MKISQIIENGYSPSQILNLDETSLNFAIGPKYVYLPKDQTRVIAESCNSKARVI